MRDEDVKSGVRIRCTNGNFTPRRTDPYNMKNISLPCEGQIYTIRELVQTEAAMGIRLLEVQNKKFRHDVGGVQEPCFSLSRFELVKKE